METSESSGGYWPTEEWQYSSPEAQGMDSNKLVRLFEPSDSSIHSILIIRHGYIVLEAYAPGISSDSPQPIYSATKSFTSAMVGIALAKGYLASLDQRVLDFFPNRKIADPNPRKSAITLQDLMTMMPGVDWWEWGPFDGSNCLMQMESSWDWVQFFLDRPMLEDPGTVWRYNTGCAHTLAAIVQQSTGMALADFASENLFNPIGITNVRWPADSHSISYGGRGIYMTASDMARFGYLYVRQGVWEGQQVIPKEWVKESTQKRTPVSVSPGEGYAYLWWVPGFGGVSAKGYMGQRIFVLPEQDLVVVITAAMGSQAMHTAPEMMMEHIILPAVTSWNAIPENPAGLAELNARVGAFGQRW